jgi:hypothetical protein
MLSCRRNKKETLWVLLGQNKFKLKDKAKIKREWFLLGPKSNLKLGQTKNKIKSEAGPN